MLLIEHAPLNDLLEASYLLNTTREAWTEQVMGALLAVTGSKAGAAFHFTSGYEKGEFRIRSTTMSTSIGCPPAAVALGTVMSLPGPMNEAMLGKTTGTTAADISGLGANLARMPGFYDCWPEHVVDSLGLVARDANGDGFCACVGLDQLGKLDAREARMLTKLATHVGAGDRLRRIDHARPLDDAEAILTPDGNVLHATPHAQKQRERLEDGRLRRLHAQKSADDPVKALEVWRGLVAGRWSLVDHFDTDGKRFVLAMKNTPQVEKRSALTPRERRVCALAAMGHRDKEIAYALGLSTASVAAALHRSREKLGVRSRAELARAWRQSE